MENTHLEKRATPNRLHELANANLLDAEELEEGLHIIGVFPDRAAWVKFLDRGFLIMGAAFVLSGISSFFAFNWAAMDRFLKFGFLGGFILAGAGFASYRGLRDLPAKISLTAAAFIVGILIAIIDQSYPSGASGGAESYRLFFGWAVLITGWVLISRFIPLWFLLLTLINIGVTAYWNQALGGSNMGMYAILFSVNAIAVIAWELGQKANIEWIKNRWTLRLAGFMAILFLVIPTIQFIIEQGYSNYSQGENLLAAPIMYLIACSITLYYYSQKQKDIFMLTTGSFSLIAVVTAYVIRAMEFNSEGAFLIIAILILVQTAAAVRWLRKVDESSEVTI